MSNMFPAERLKWITCPQRGRGVLIDTGDRFAIYDFDGIVLDDIPGCLTGPYGSQTTWPNIAAAKAEAQRRVDVDG